MTICGASLDGRRLLLGEVKWSGRPFPRAAVESEARAVAAKPAPLVEGPLSRAEAVRALFVPDLEDARLREIAGVVIVTAADLS